MPFELQKALDLVPQDIENKLGIAERVADACSLQPAIEIVLDQAMVRVAREGERVQPQRIDQLLGESPQTRSSVGKMGEVEENYVVAEQEFGSVGIVVKFVEGACEGSAIVDEWLGLAWPNGCKALDAVATWINFEIDRNASGQKLCQLY